MNDSSLAREVRRLALPAIFHSLLQTLVFVVDRIMLGRHGGASLAAMQIGGTFEWSLWSVFAAFEVGTIARVGRLVGAGDRAGARRVVWLSLGLAVGIGTIVAIATPLVVGGLPLVADRVSPEAMSEAQAYLGVTVTASPVVFVAAAAIAALQAGGDTRTPLAIGIVANVVHVALNRVLILGFAGVPALGARGAGISTVVTFAIEAALATVALTSTKRVVSLRASSTDESPADAANVRAEARELIRVGGPAFVERLLYHVGFLCYAVLITRLGDASMTANQSLISVESVCFFAADGFGVAASALVAQKLGAKRLDEAHRVAWIAARDGIATLTVFGIVAFALRGFILPVFSHDEVVLAIGRRTFPLLTLAQPFMATGIVLAMALRGAGRTRHALAVTFTGAVFVRLTATWLLTAVFGLGLVGVWLGSTVDWVVRTVALSALWRKGVFLRREGRSAAPDHPSMGRANPSGAPEVPSK